MRKRIGVNNICSGMPRLFILTILIIISTKAKSQSDSIDTLITNSSKFGLIRINHLTYKLYSSDTLTTIDSDAVFLTDSVYHPLFELNSDNFNFIHESEPDTITIKEILLDSKTNGVLISRHYSKYCAYMNTIEHWSIDANRVQIWNLRSRALVFDFYTYYHYSELIPIHEGKPDEQDSTYACSCSNNFQILGVGLIKTSAISTSNDSLPPCDINECDIKAGEYRFSSGQFIKVK